MFPATMVLPRFDDPVGSYRPPPFTAVLPLTVQLTIVTVPRGAGHAPRAGGAGLVNVQAPAFSRGVAGQGHVDEREGAAVVVDPAAVDGRGVPADRAVGQEDCAGQTDAHAAAVLGGVAANRAVGERHRAAQTDVHAAAVLGGVAAQGAVGKRDRACVGQTAAIPWGRAARDRESAERGRHAALNLEDADGPVAIDRYADRRAQDFNRRRRS